MKPGMDPIAAKELNNSSLWREVEKEIDYRVQMLMESLMSCPAEDLLNIRTRVEALKELKTIPTQVIERDE
jgi:hypothetical protein